MISGCISTQVQTPKPTLTRPSTPTVPLTVTPTDAPSLTPTLTKYLSPDFFGTGDCQNYPSESQIDGHSFLALKYKTKLREGLRGVHIITEYIILYYLVKTKKLAAHLYDNYMIASCKRIIFVVFYVLIIGWWFIYVLAVRTKEVLLVFGHSI